MKLISVVGTRPNFMKIAPIMHELAIRHDELLMLLLKN